MPWLSPECARGEMACTLSDVYSFCCLVWETCSEKLPWSHLDSMEISRMWQKDHCSKPKMLSLGPAIPLHVGSFLKLGLQPELSERREMDLQEIYLMLRLQGAAISHSQQKENQKSSSPTKPARTPSTTAELLGQSQIQPQHKWDAVKERLKKRITPPTPPLPPPLPPPPPPASPASPPSPPQEQDQNLQESNVMGECDADDVDDEEEIEISQIAP